MPRARKEIHEAAIWWAENRSVEQAVRWLKGIEAAIDSLDQNPERHSFARENGLFLETLRQLPFSLGARPTHRAVFDIEGDRVRVVSVRHLAQQDLTPDDLHGS